MYNRRGMPMFVLAMGMAGALLAQDVTDEFQLAV